MTSEVRGPKSESRRVLLVSHTTGYQLRAFNEAAEALGIALVFATDRCHRLDDPWQDRAVAVRFHDLDGSLAAIVARARQTPIQGVLAVGDRPVVLAARAAEALGLSWHTVEGARASTDKRRSRAMLATAGLPAPRFVTLPADRPQLPASASPLPADGFPLPASGVQFPVVLKPVGLSGSRGVIRANDAREFEAAFERIRALLARPQIRAARAGLEDEILVESYIDGREFALEGVLTNGALQVLALFDKPDLLNGPFFEETIYVTPSRLTAHFQARVAEMVQRAAVALGLRHGPVHAECRIAPDGKIYVLEVAARPIGGLCSRVLAFDDDEPRDPGTRRTPRSPRTPRTSLEHVLLRHALGERIDGVHRETAGAAVMMVPIPRRGMLRGVSGDESARRVAGVTEIRITAKVGQILESLPEAGSYLGFIFARGETAREADTAVRAAHACLRFDISNEIALAARS
jgi:D-alanine-D-alanine ligase-like ATP-grasp enzyme